MNLVIMFATVRTLTEFKLTIKVAETKKVHKTISLDNYFFKLFTEVRI